MSDSIAERIAQRMSALPKSERRAAQTLVADYPLIGLRTAAEFSVKAGVSAPTVLRLAARLGFASYPEFQAALKDELAERLQSPFSRSSNTPPDDSGPLIAATLDNITETMRHLPAAQIAEMAQCLANDKARVFLAGGRFTDPLARYMAAHLKVIRPNVFHLTGQESTWRDQLIDMGKRDVLVLFDIRRYSEFLESFAAKAHGRGVQIIVFTDQWLSPAARFARHVIAGRTAVPSPWDSSAALFAAAETVIMETTRARGAAAGARIKEAEKLRGD